MAQLERKDGYPDRLNSLIRQRPGLVIGVTLAVGLVAGSAAFGVVHATSAGDFEIVRAESSIVEARVDDADETGEDADSSASGERSTDTAPDAEKAPVVVVDVSGAVKRPSVVTLNEGDRVQDAIDEAGGLADDADAASVNRAARLADGQKVYVPRVGETGTPSGSSGEAGEAADLMSNASTLVNINTATLEELDTLSGVGPSTAQAILDDRDANGPFSSIEDLMRVSGIGEKKFEKLKSSICV